MRVIYWLRLCPPDQKPKDDRQFCSCENAREPVNNRCVRWQKKRGKGTRHVAETCNEQQEAQYAGNETRSNNQNPERKQPKPPEELRNDKSLAMQPDKQVGEGIQLTGFKHRQKTGAIHDDQCSDIVEQIQKRDRDRDQKQGRHRQSMFLINALE